MYYEVKLADVVNHPRKLYELKIRKSSLRLKEGERKYGGRSKDKLRFLPEDSQNRNGKIAKMQYRATRLYGSSASTDEH